MDKFLVFAIGITGIWSLVILKLVIDQMKFFKHIRKRIDPPYPVLPGEGPQNFASLVSTGIGKNMLQRLKLTLSRYPKHPDLDRLASQVRFDVFLMFAVMLVVAITLYIAAPYITS